jgi:hypothetical protein
VRSWPAALFLISRQLAAARATTAMGMTMVQRIAST